MKRSRRTHKKSRAGCRRCKHRKIKCDEVHPRCGNCCRHGVVCDFEGRPLHDAVEPVPSVSSTSSPAASTPAVATATTSPIMSFPSPLALNTETTPRPADRPDRLPHQHTAVTAAAPVVSPSLSFPSPLPLNPETTPRPADRPDRLLELRLLHQYTTGTCKTLVANSAAADDVWQRAVPEMAFGGRAYLADAMLCVAALHLRSQQPGDRCLVRASHAYTASTLAAYVSTLNSGITADNAEALFLTATLIAFQATASRIFIKDDAETGGDAGPRPYTLPMAWFHACQGVKTVVSSSWQWIRSSAVVRTVVDSQPSFQLDLNPLSPASFFGHLLEDLDDELADEPIHRVTATHQGYFHAVSVLNWAHRNPDATAALAFPASVSRRFVEVVEEKRPRALAILACFFALFQRLPPVWWLGDVSRREVMGLVSLFETGSTWWRHLEWPVRIALWDGGPVVPPKIWGVDYGNEAETVKPSSESMMSHIELFSKLSAHTPAAASSSAPSSLEAELELMTAPMD